jgi:hypothetical protein
VQHDSSVTIQHDSSVTIQHISSAIIRNDMAAPNEKLAAALEQVRELQADGSRVFSSKQLSRVARERLVKHGFLREVMKGWQEISHSVEYASCTAESITSRMRYSVRQPNPMSGTNTISSSSAATPCRMK